MLEIIDDIYRDEGAQRVGQVAPFNLTSETLFEATGMDPVKVIAEGVNSLRTNLSA